MPPSGTSTISSDRNRPTEYFVDPAPGSWRRWAIFVIGSLNFLLSMFYRVSTAVISPALAGDLGLSSGQLSDLSAVFFYAFAVSQIPIGVALDRVGSRITLAFLACAAISGTVIFATGQTFLHLLMGRILLGIGMSGNLMVLLALLAVWFPVNRFAFLSGVAVSIGALGNLLAATPLALMSLWIGWRGSFFIFAAVNTVIVGTLLLVIRNHPSGTATVSWRSPSLTSGLVHVFSTYSYWAISLSSFVRYGYLAALQGLWAAPFLVYGMGMGEIDSSNVLLSMAVGYMLGLPLSGFLSDSVLHSRKRIILGSLVAFLFLTISVLWLTPSTSLPYIMFIFFWLGFVAAPGQIMYAHIKELLPSSMIAQAITSVNLFTVLGAGIITQVLGLWIGDDPATVVGPAGFWSLWYVGAVALAVVCLLYAFVPDSKIRGKST
ncbi:MAG: MFS transporter [Desulfomonilaceae bacterium]